MNATEALRTLVHENSRAGIEYAADILRAEGFTDASDLLWSRRNELAAHLTSIDDEAGYEQSEAMRLLVDVVTKADGAA